MSHKDTKFYINRGLVGLKNIGNTCYLNSSLQALSNTLPLTHYILSDNWKKDISEQNKKRHEFYILSNFIRLLVTIWSTEYDKSKPNEVIVPKTFKSNLEVFVKKYVGFDQHDAHECITYILEYIHKACSRESQMNIKEGEYSNDIKQGVERWKELYEKDYSIIIDLFYGELQGVTKCIQCNYTSKIYDPYSTITLLLPNNNDIVTLQHLLKDYLNDKNITDWNCENCKKITECSHETNIISMPPVLMIHLKRFKGDDKRMVKNNNEVEFNMEENIYGRKYKLYSVIHHTGGLNGGHYVNTSLNKNGNWYLYNDASVSLCTHEKILNKRTSYVLFYEKVN